MRNFRNILEQGLLIEGLIEEISLSGLLATMLVAFLCAMLIYSVYRFFYRGLYTVKISTP